MILIIKVMINLGMYTGIRCKVIIKPEYRDELKKLDYNGDKSYYDWSKSNIDFMQEYGKYSRARFIPCGALAYMPDCWEQAPYDKYGDGVPTDGFDTNFNYETGLWTFQCSLKNYDDTIEYFFENVLSKIVKEIIHLETFYEENSHGVLYKLENNKIIVKDQYGVKYSEDDENYIFR
jgi:hypothetical protein